MKLIISESEKKNILIKHSIINEIVSESGDNYVIDQTKAIPTGTTMSNGMNVFRYDTSPLNKHQIVFVYTEENFGQNYSCVRHENGKYGLSPKGTLTKEESQKIYDAFCTKSGQSQKDFITPIFPGSLNTQPEENNQPTVF